MADDDRSGSFLDAMRSRMTTREKSCADDAAACSETKEKEHVSEDPEKRRRRCVEEELRCSVCLGLLAVDPTTLPCQHTFHISCLLRAWDHSNRCPVCRSLMHITPSRDALAVNTVLRNVCEQLFPEEAEELRSVIAQESNVDEHALPLFVLRGVCLFPTCPLPLHVFEPRYRLMIKRCLQGSRRFGVVNRIGDGIGTLAEIVDYCVMPDGRMFLKTVGQRRFRFTQWWDLDEYAVAGVTWLDDELQDAAPRSDGGEAAGAAAVRAVQSSLTQPPSGEPSEILDATTLRASFCRSLHSFLQSLSSSTRSQLQEHLGEEPDAVTPHSWWACAVLCSVLSLDIDTQLTLLRLTSADARYERLADVLEAAAQTESAPVRACSLQ